MFTAKLLDDDDGYDNHDDDDDEDDDDDGGGDDDGKFVCLPLNLSPHLAKSETPIVASITKTDILLSSAFHFMKRLDLKTFVADWIDHIARMQNRPYIKTINVLVGLEV